MKTPREVLIDASIARMYNHNAAAVKDYMDRHATGRLSPYADCSDFTCEAARDYADEVLNSLEAAGYHPVQRSGPVIHLGEEAAAKFLEELDKPAEVNETLRELLQRRGPLDG